MALTFNEELIAHLVAEFNQANPAFQVNWQTYIVGQIKEGRYGSPIVLLENEGHFVIIYTGTFDAKKISKVRIIDKNEIQGLRAKYGALNAVFKFRLFNGDDGKLLLTRRASKKLPRQVQNLNSLMEVLNLFYDDRQDMRDHSSSMATKIFGLVFMLVLMGIGIFVGIKTESKGLAYLTIIIALAVGGWIATKAELFINRQKDKDFVKASEQIDSQVTTMTEEQYYQAMKAINPKPKTQLMQGAYLQGLITVAHNLNLQDEARELLAQFPRRYSSKAEEAYNGLQNLLLTNEKVPYEYEKAPLDVEQDVWQKYQ